MGHKKKLLHKKALLVGGTLLIVTFFVLTNASIFIFETPKTTKATPLIKEVERCREETPQVRIHCYDETFAHYLNGNTPKELLNEFVLIMEESPQTRRDCHQVAHSIGRETLRRVNNLAAVFEIGRKVDICAGGFFHGATEALFRKNTQEKGHISFNEAQEKIPGLCKEFAKMHRRGECIHGIGHGILYLAGYDLNRVLDSCERMDSQERFPCYTGIFMENFIASDSLHRVVSEGNPQVPCRDQKGPRQDPCYYVLSFRLKELGFSDDAIVQECGKVEGEAGELCLRGFGIFYLAHEVLAGGPSSIVFFCESLGNKNKLVCAESVAARLAAITEDGTYFMPFCSLFTSRGLRQNCFGYARNVLKIGFGVEQKTIQNECRKFAPGIAECF